MRAVSIDELHELLLAMAQEMHSILTKHSIPYYMLGGSQLGAVRHKDIIPWDDDMDFGVPRQYFDKAIKVLSQEFPERYKIHSTYDSPRMLGDLCKIEDTTTLIQETGWKSHLKDEMGVFIDIFPLDYSNGKYGFFSRDHIIDSLLGIQKYRFFSIKPRPFVKKIIALFIKFIFCWMNRKFVTSFIRNFMLKKSGTHYANYYGAWGRKETVAISAFGEPTLYKMNKIELFGVQDYDTYLKSLYKNYMELPPVEKRKAHIAGMFYRESD